MEFEWDEGKDAANRTKHGVSLGEALLIDWSSGVTVRDDRRDYGEPRWIRFALLSGRLHTCVFTGRAEALRIISLRKSSSREIRKYGTTTPKTDDRF